MKVYFGVILSWLTAAPSVLYFVCGEQPINCRWGPYGDWSECDGCTRTQTRTRPVQMFAQFGGAPCLGEPMEKQECVPKKSCPLDMGCGDRFRCSSGQCINMALVCNGDQDCEEDGLDEQNCDKASSSIVCDNHRVPPNIELTGKGFNMLTGELRGAVINTKSFGGQCRNIFSGDHKTLYRLPESTLGYSFQVIAENDFSDEAYNSSWSYVKHTEKRQTFRRGHRYETFHKELKNDKAQRLLIIKNEVEVAQFQNSPPEYLPLSEELWKAFLALPVTYEVSAYRSLIQTYGTHFLSEGSLGGQYQVLLQFDAESMQETRKRLRSIKSSTTHFCNNTYPEAVRALNSSPSGSSDLDYHNCVKTVKRRFFRKKTTIKCEKIINSLKNTKGFSNNKIPVKTDILGGHPAYIAGLSYIDLENPTANSDMYSKWAGSVKDFPQIIKQKLRPLHELVKEVPCAALKKLHLKRAIQTYLEEDHPCHCRPCQNNGHALLLGTSCTCICPLDTSGPSCQYGTVLEEQPGVVHGDWSCWSSWGSCSGGRRSRTRSCSNPPPKMGGRHCTGEPVDHQTCVDEDLQHLQMMEPHCFDSSLMPNKICKTPPPLRNGFIMDLKDIYSIGSKIVYSCIEGHHIIGDPVAECTDQLTWMKHAMECKRTVCGPPPLQNKVTGTPWKWTYQIGERVSLSCPPGTQREGLSEIACDSSLNWPPSTEAIRCQAVSAEVPEESKLQCESWKKPVKDHCVCKMPYECSSSLDVCATDSGRGLTHKLSVCKIKALECLGRRYTLAEDSACDWPKHEATPCPACQLWEKCDERSSMCSCREVGQCSEPGSQLCVRLGEDAIAMTMKECEAGIRRCRGYPITIVALGPCSS